MWFVILVATPIVAIIMATHILRKQKTVWIEFNNTDARPEAEPEPVPDYDDPYLRPDHPFWQGKPPPEVIAGGYTWEPPNPREITPPVRRTPRDLEEESEMLEMDWEPSEPPREARSASYQS